MKLTAVFEPAREGGYTCFVEEIPAAISQGETIEEAKANLIDALRLVLQCQRELAEKELSPDAVREPLQLLETGSLLPPKEATQVPSRIDCNLAVANRRAGKVACRRSGD